MQMRWYFHKDSNLSFTGSNRFSGNSAMEYGGRVYPGSNSWVKISGNTTLTDNLSCSGGGVGAQDNSSTIISGNTTFILLKALSLH